MFTRSGLLRAGLTLVAILCVWWLAAGAQAGPSIQPAADSDPRIHPAGPLDFKVNNIDGREVNLADYKGKVVLIVNVASGCRYTSQYTGLQSLYVKYGEKGFVVLAFPANNFGTQEPGTNQAIKAFATSRYHVTFPMMAKISAKGDDQNPLYRFLTAKATGGEFAGEIEWNFTKFIVGRGGKVVARFPSKVKPEDPPVVEAIEKAMADKP
ncbi:MAG TPA: glutathione peroxidase [Tepidisphaeraceae bacterium]|jgi:glutathione peroxidase|nr:glutathione peroxidase [Tepidisphaeraceae bacterium]